MMFKRPKYFFNRELKKEFLRGFQGITISEKSGISYSYLSRILRSVDTADDFIIENIMHAIGYKQKEIKELKNHYFTLRK